VIRICFLQILLLLCTLTFYGASLSSWPGGLSQIKQWVDDYERGVGQLPAYSVHQGRNASEDCGILAERFRSPNQWMFPETGGLSMSQYHPVQMPLSLDPCPVAPPFFNEVATLQDLIVQFVDQRCQEKMASQKEMCEQERRRWVLTTLHNKSASIANMRAEIDTLTSRRFAETPNDRVIRFELYLLQHTIQQINRLHDSIVTTVTRYVEKKNGKRTLEVRDDEEDWSCPMRTRRLGIARIHREAEASIDEIEISIKYICFYKMFPEQSQKEQMCTELNNLQEAIGKIRDLARKSHITPKEQLIFECMALENRKKINDASGQKKKRSNPLPEPSPPVPGRVHMMQPDSMHLSSRISDPTNFLSRHDEESDDLAIEEWMRGSEAQAAFSATDGDFLGKKDGAMVLEASMQGGGAQMLNADPRSSDTGYMSDDSLSVEERAGDMAFVDEWMENHGALVIEKFKQDLEQGAKGGSELELDRLKKAVQLWVCAQGAKNGGAALERFQQVVESGAIEHGVYLSTFQFDNARKSESDNTGALTTSQSQPKQSVSNNADQEAKTVFPSKKDSDSEQRVHGSGSIEAELRRGRMLKKKQLLRLIAKMDALNSSEKNGALWQERLGLIKDIQELNQLVDDECKKQPAKRDTIRKEGVSEVNGKNQTISVRVRCKAMSELRNLANVGVSSRKCGDDVNQRLRAMLQAQSKIQGNAATSLE